MFLLMESYFSYDDIDYSESLGNTSHHVRSQLAYKFADDKFETVIRDVEWSMGKTGQLTPVAVFDPVEIDDTIVERASLHNVNIFKSYELSVGDTITVYKANMIIPQISENLTRSGVRDIPETCPACGGATRIQMMNNVETLYCTNPECPAKFMKAFTLFVSRDAMNIDGMCEFADIFRLDRYRDEIVEMDGFGEKSYQNLIDSIERAKNTTLPRLIFGLGILNIGLANARMICKAFDFDLDRIRNASAEGFAQIDGVGEVIAKSIVDYFADEENKERLERLLSYLTIEKPGRTEISRSYLRHHRKCGTFPEPECIKGKNRGARRKSHRKCNGKDELSDQQRHDIQFLQKPESTRTRRAGDLRRGISEDDRRITKYLQRRFASRAGICYNRKRTAEIPARKSKPPVCAEKSAADQEE